MRSATLGLVVVVLLAAALPVASTAAEGDAFKLESLGGGRALEPGDLESGSVIIVFWAGWSPRCRDIVERTNKIVDDWSDRARVIAVNFQEEPDAVREFIDGKLEAAVYLDADGAFSKQHTMTSLPGLLIYRDGEVAFRGKLPADPGGLIGQTLN